MSEDELLTGRAGEEFRQGFTPMPMASTPVERPDDISIESALTEDELSHFKRPEPPAPIERQYQDLETGEERPDNETVPLERAADDLKAIREAEALELQEAQKEALNRALDGEPEEQLQPETLEPQAESAPLDTSAADDAEIQRLLQNPTLRERVATEIKQHAAVADYARSHYTQAATALSQQVSAMALVQFPELAPFAGNPQQMAGALAMLAKENPARAQEVQNYANQAAMVHDAARQAQVEQQRAMQERQQQEFARYAVAEDTKAFSKTSPEELTQIRNYIFEEGGKLGISREQITQTWNSNVALRSAFVSELAADGVRYRLAQRGIAAHRHNPIAKVQRPGVSDGSRGADPGDASAALSRLDRPGGNVGQAGIRNAADWLTARRARGG